MIRNLIPTSLKRNIRLAQRRLADYKTGIRSNFARLENYPNRQNLVLLKTITQPIFYNPLSANKVVNIRIATAEIKRYAIQPNTVFSFWEMVKKPTLKKGYQIGRNIIGNNLKEDIGGGLCQVSGILYHLALETGMEIIERHNHTLDLYEEDKRYTPLGADATVVYGYKDLRFKNPHNTTLFLEFSVTETSFSATFLGAKEIVPYSIRFERFEEPNKRTIKTYRKSEGDHEELLNLSHYRI